LPVTRKHELLERQQAARAGAAGGDPFGGFSAIGWRALGALRPARRVFQSPGPIYEPEGAAADYWRFGRALFAAGFRAGDLVHNSFSYHLTPAGSMVECGAHAIGCTVFPGGVGNTELQLQAMAELRPEAYAGTPSFLRIALEKADAGGLALPSLRKASVGGEAFPAALRDALQARGIEAYQNYGTADLGLVAYETAAREGLVLDEGVIVEIVRPGTGDPVATGEVGEIVVTALNPDYPLLRFAPAICRHCCPAAAHRPQPCAHTRLAGAGRPDRQGARHVRAPGPAGRGAEAPPRGAAGRLVIEGEMANDRMTLHAECGMAADGLAAALADSLRDVTKLRGEVRLVAPGSLPNDGKVIEDARPHDGPAGRADK